MGNLLKVLNSPDLEHEGPNFFLDFENAEPSEAERDVWEEVNAVLSVAETLLSELRDYPGAGSEIREAISHPEDEAAQGRVWAAVCPLVSKLKGFYEFSVQLERAMVRLLEVLTAPPCTPVQHLEREQALAKQFAQILHFTLQFDELKMTNPSVQNDFSFYRRTLSRMRMTNSNAGTEAEVSNEMANRMSLFYAESTPMLKTLSNATTRFVSEHESVVPLENTTDCLSTMASLCKAMLDTPEYRCRFGSEDSMLFCLRVMVGLIILYDHVHPVGAFAKTSKLDVGRGNLWRRFRITHGHPDRRRLLIDCRIFNEAPVFLESEMKGCIKVLKEQPQASVEGLLNALRYTTRHINDETSCKQIKNMLQ